MNYERLDAAATDYIAIGGDAALIPFKAGASWFEDEMIRNGILIRLVDGPADRKVMPRPVIGHEVTFRTKNPDGSILLDSTYRIGTDGNWRYVKP